MAYQLTQQIEVLNPHSNIDLSYGPYDNVAKACEAIIEDMRKCGKTVLIGTDEIGYTEYWWKNGIKDEDLVIKGGQGLQGPKGEDGKDGADGISVTHSWNGTTLTITSASGTSSANLKGADGQKPEKGTDYFTKEDKEEFVKDIKSGLNEIQTISNPNTTIDLSTKIINITLTDSNNTDISFSYIDQNECTIVIYNKTGNYITLPTNYKIEDYTTVLVNKISSVTLLDKASCEINIMFTNGECRILTIV